MSDAVDQAWATLAAHSRELTGRTLRDEFASDPGRFDRLSRRHGDLLLDTSKCLLTTGTVAALMALLRATGVEAQRDAMFAGAAINDTEGRAVMHVGLRAPEGVTVPAGGRDFGPDVLAVRAASAAFAQAVREGSHVGATEDAFTDVVNIGIGGSDLGPAMVTAALAPYHDGPRVHFVSNVDGAHLADTLRHLDPRHTLFVIASKTFTTLETMRNAHSARAWITDALGEAAVAAHFAAVSTALDKVGTFGIRQDRIFGFWDWVGGRFSLWSAIGLPVMIAVGPERFAELLAGAHDMDRHFQTAPLEDNLPALLAATWIWHRDLCGYASRAVLPYDQRLALLPAHLQQLIMESNGKSVRRDGSPVAHPTSAVVWGEPGTNGQHAFFQLLHQGTEVIPCEFLIAGEGHEPALRLHHELLIANCLAQSEALAFGRTAEEARDQLRKQGKSAAEVERLAPHKTFPGNRPSVTLAYRKLDPATLGRIIALYEHAVAVEAAVHGINAFDQWGVELGKDLALDLLPAVQGKAAAPACSSTAGLLAHIGANS